MSAVFIKKPQIFFMWYNQKYFIVFGVTTFPFGFSQRLASRSYGMQSKYIYKFLVLIVTNSMLVTPETSGPNIVRTSSNRL